MSSVTQYIDKAADLPPSTALYLTGNEFRNQPAQLAIEPTLVALGRESGARFDFLTGRGAIVDRNDPTRAWTGNAQDKLVYASPSPKMMIGPDGTLKFVNHNLLRASQDFSNQTAWVRSGTYTFNSDVFVAPDGTLTGDRMDCVNETMFNDTPAASGLTHRVSVYLKYVSLQWVRFQFGDTAANNALRLWVDLQNGVLGSTAQVGTLWNLIDAPTMEYLPEHGWYRISFTVMVSASTARLYILSSNGDLSIVRGTGSYGVWGGQLQKLPCHSAAYFENPGLTPVSALPFDYDPNTLAAMGLLCEPQRSNLILNSGFVGAVAGTPGTAPAPWQTVHTGSPIIGVSAGQISGSYKIRCEANGGRAQFYQTVSVTANTVYFWSAYVDVEVSGAFFQFLTVVNAPAGSTVEYFLDGVSVAGSSGPGVGRHLMAIRLTVVATAGTPQFRWGSQLQGAGGGIVSFERIQLEASPYRTSDIPTGLAQVTRAGDEISINGSVLGWNTQAVTLAWASDSPVNPSSASGILSSQSSNARYAYSNGGQATNFAFDGASSYSWGDLVEGTPNTWVMSMSPARVRRRRNATFRGAAVVPTNNNFLTLLTLLRIGSRYTGAAQMRGHFTTLVYLKRETDDAEMITLEASL